MRKADLCHHFLVPLGDFGGGGWIVPMNKVAGVWVVLCGRFPVKEVFSTLIVRVHWQHHTVQKEKLADTLW